MNNEDQIQKMKNVVDRRRDQEKDTPCPYCGEPLCQLCLLNKMCQAHGCRKTLEDSFVEHAWEKYNE